MGFLKKLKKKVKKVAKKATKIVKKVAKPTLAIHKAVQKGAKAAFKPTLAAVSGGLIGGSQGGDLLSHGLSGITQKLGLGDVDLSSLFADDPPDVAPLPTFKSPKAKKLNGLPEAPPPPIAADPETASDGKPSLPIVPIAIAGAAVLAVVLLSRRR